MEESLNISKEKLTAYENISNRKINISENDSNVSPDLIKRFSFSRYASLFRQDFDMANLEKWTELICTKCPRRRCYHSSFIYSDNLYVFAGMDINDGKMNDLYRINLSAEPNSEEFLKWHEIPVKGDIPGELSYLRGCVDEEHGKFYTFGGENIYQRYPNDLYILNIENKSWEKKTFNENIIIGVTGHTLDFSLVTNELIVFGGFAKGNYLNDLFIYDLGKNNWSKISFADKGQEKSSGKYPGGRMLHSSCLINNYLYIFGGKTDDGIYLNDFWRFDLINRFWEKIKPNGEVPKGRSGHSSVASDNFIYFFGGKVGDLQERNEFWKYNIEQNSFLLIHDTMLEQHSELGQDVSFMNKDLSKKFSRKMGKTIHNKSNDQFLTDSINMLKTKDQSKLIKKKNMKNTNLSNLEQKYEEMILCSPNSKKMKNSMIYKLEITGHSNLKSKVSSLIQDSQLNSGNFDKIRSGVLPAPRDGHTMNYYKNMIYIFGGDRNRFPFNDLFSYNLN